MTRIRVKNFFRLVTKNPTPMASMTCMATSTSGWRMTGMITTMEHRLTVVPGWIIQGALTAWFAAAAGAAALAADGRPAAEGRDFFS